jgi:hypothetical protein
MRKLQPTATNALLSSSVVELVEVGDTFNRDMHGWLLPKGRASNRPPTQRQHSSACLFNRHAFGCWEWAEWQEMCLTARNSVSCQWQEMCLTARNSVSCQCVGTWIRGYSKCTWVRRYVGTTNVRWYMGTWVLRLYVGTWVRGYSECTSVRGYVGTPNVRRNVGTWVLRMYVGTWVRGDSECTSVRGYVGTPNVRVNRVPNKQLLGFDCVLQCQFRQQGYDRTEKLVSLHTGQYCWKPGLGLISSCTVGRGRECEQIKP